MQKPSTEDQQWTMITPVVADSVRYLVQITDYLLRDNNRLAGFQTEIQQKFQNLSQSSTQTLLQLNYEVSKTSYLTMSNSSKIQHIYSICNLAEERINKSEQRLEVRMTELSSGLYETLATRTSDMVKMIDAKYQQFAAEIAKNTQTIKANQKVVDEKLALITANAQVLQKRIDDMQTKCNQQFQELGDENGKIRQFSVRELEAKAQAISGLQYQLEAYRTEVQYLSAQLSAANRRAEESDNSVAQQLETVNQHVHKLIDIPAQLAQLTKQFGTLSQKVEKIQDNYNSLVAQKAQSEQDYFIYAVRERLEQKEALNSDEQEILQAMHELHEKVRSGEYTAQELEYIKAQVMQNVLSSGMVDDAFVENLMQQIGDFTEMDYRTVIDSATEAKATIESIHRLADFDPNGENDDGQLAQQYGIRYLQFMTSMRGAQDQVSEHYQAAGAVSCGKLTAEIVSGQPAHVVRQVEQAKHLLKENHALYLELAYEQEILGRSEAYMSQLSAQSPDGSFREMRMTQQHQNYNKNIQLQLIDFKQRLEQIQKKHEEDVARLKIYVNSTVDERVLRQMNNCGLGDFLQLDSRPQAAGCSAYNAKTGAESMSEQSAEDCLFSRHKSSSQAREKFKRGFSSGQKILNSPVGSQSLKYFPKMDKLDESNTSMTGRTSSRLDELYETPPLAPAPDRPRSAGRGTSLLNKNFFNSQIYQELRTELHKSVASDNEVLFYKYMKEIARLDKLVDLENQEIVNVEERLKKLFRNPNYPGFRRTAVSSAAYVSRGVQINVYKPVLLIGYTGEGK